MSRRAALAIGGGLAAAHAAPALGAVGPVRRLLLPRYAGRGRPDHVALTFDDGPQRSSTPRFLDLLDTLEVRATFFVIGRSAAADRELVGEMAARGHELAVHGWAHRLLLRRSPAATVADIRRTRDLVVALTGVAPRWYRPPYGVASAAALAGARRCGLVPVLWTAWGRDWTRRATAGSVTRAVRRGRTAGGTVLLHDVDTFAADGSWRAPLAALPELVAGWRDEGLAVGRLDEHHHDARSGPR